MQRVATIERKGDNYLGLLPTEILDLVDQELEKENLVVLDYFLRDLEESGENNNESFHRAYDVYNKFFEKNNIGRKFLFDAYKDEHPVLLKKSTYISNDSLVEFLSIYFRNRYTVKMSLEDINQKLYELGSPMRIIKRSLPETRAQQAARLSSRNKAPKVVYEIAFLSSFKEV